MAKTEPAQVGRNLAGAARVRHRRKTRRGGCVHAQPMPMLCVAVNGEAVWRVAIGLKPVNACEIKRALTTNMAVVDAINA